MSDVYPAGEALVAWAQAEVPEVAPDLVRFIAEIPKVELHVHLEGTLEAEMKFALAKRNGLDLPFADVAAMKQSYVYHDLPSFLAIYYDGMKVLLTEQDFYDLTHAYLTKAAAQNVIYAELFFDPQEHLKRGVAMEAIIGGIARAQEDADQTLGIGSQLVLCFVRDLSAESAMEALDAALPMKDKLVGIGLDSDEKDNPPEKFAAHFAKARGQGLKITTHCDIDQIGTHDNIRMVISTIDVDRIDHGGNILEVPDLIAMAKEKDLAFTICPTFSGTLRNGPKPVDVVRGMLDAGLKVTINSDDPAYMASEYMNEVLVRAVSRSQLSKAELVEIQRNAFDATWLPGSQKAALKAKLEAFVEETRAAA
jgi:adenine deaminase